jgi:hypothetical protein
VTREEDTGGDPPGTRDGDLWEIKNCCQTSAGRGSVPSATSSEQTHSEAGGGGGVKDDTGLLHTPPLVSTTLHTPSLPALEVLGDVHDVVLVLSEARHPQIGILRRGATAAGVGDVIVLRPV